ncbi:hypothetical protein Tco_0941132 [Tanacetum coccineum]|uniref:Uncharacterized protein n=1 Tax=Tanacetum coccineum TaxID=301880 RepID=A0ABQ5DSB6_9ASTR
MVAALVAVTISKGCGGGEGGIEFESEDDFELEADAVFLLKQIWKFSMTQDIRARWVPDFLEESDDEHDSDDDVNELRRIKDDSLRSTFCRLVMWMNEQRQHIHIKMEAGTELEKAHLSRLCATKDEKCLTSLVKALQHTNEWGYDNGHKRTRVPLTEPKNEEMQAEISVMEGSRKHHQDEPSSGRSQYAEKATSVYDGSFQDNSKQVYMKGNSNILTDRSLDRLSPPQQKTFQD